MVLYALALALAVQDTTATPKKEKVQVNKQMMEQIKEQAKHGLYHSVRNKSPELRKAEKIRETVRMVRVFIFK